MNTVRIAADNLVLVIGQMLDLLSVLMALAKQKEALIIADDVKRLEALLEDEAETACALKQKEKTLKYRANDLCRAAGLGHKGAGLKEICAAIGDEADSKRLTAAANEMTEAVGRLKRQNEKLRALLRQRIGYADYMLNVLHSPQDRLGSYDMQGNKAEDIGHFSLLDYHA